MLLLALAAVGGCRPRVVPGATESGAARTVFTDSAMHARLCQPNAAGEDWRRVCTPIDQGVTPVRPISPPPHE